MINKDDIPSLIALLNARQVPLYHACQFIDFNSYVELGGIPSRKLLKEQGKPHTSFETDKIDVTNNVSDKIFVNLSDFGFWFGYGSNVIPNPYGPILLVISPEALDLANDVAITLRSAGATDYDREKESLNIKDVERIFAYPPDSSYPEKSYIKFVNQLRQEFDNSNAQAPEINCHYTDEIMPFKYVTKIIVDPYNFSEKFLFELAKQVIEGKYEISIYERWVREDRKIVYNELMGLIAKEILSLEKIIKSEGTSPAVKTWASEILEKNIEYQFRRFATYLLEGTIKIF